MGKRQQERASSRQRERLREQHHPPDPSDADSHQESVSWVQYRTMTAARYAAFGDEGAADACATAVLAELPAALVLPCVNSCLHELVAYAWDRGWEPIDLWQLARRRLEPGVEALVAAVTSEQMAAYAAAAGDDALAAQLAEMDGGCTRLSEATALECWRDARALRDGQAVSRAIALMALASTVPELPLVSASASGGSGGSGVRPSGRSAMDDKALARIRALLAKAEATTFPEEAEALSAKAQELMSKYSLERVAQEADFGVRGTVALRRVWLDAPYLSAKSMLIEAVARANGCRAVWSEQWGFATVVGEEADLVGVELLSTSLLVQAGQAMLVRGSHADRRGTSRTRSFRRSFLVAFAARIDQRLAEASRAGMEQAEQDRRADAGGRRADLLPVLAAREDRVAAAVAKMFPKLTTRSVSISNSEGWAAGKAAADLAHLNARGEVTGSAQSA